jgi:hypothetical protein
LIISPRIGVLIVATPFEYVAQRLHSWFSPRKRHALPYRSRLLVERLEDRLVMNSTSVAVANFIEGLQFTNPAQPGFGAILTYSESNGPGDYDASSGVPIYEVNPYFANLAVTGLLQTQATGSLQTAARWISWYLANINSDGTIDNFWYQASGAAGTPSLYPNSVQPDSEDSYAATFLTLSSDYLQAGGSASLFTAAGVQQEYETIAGAILRLQDTDGLTWVSQADHTKYLADNSEVYSGLQAMANLETTAFQSPASAATYSQAAARVSQAIQTKLFNQSTGLFDIDLQSDGTLDQADFTPGPNTTWYPTVSIIWPALNGIISPSSVEAQDQFAALDAYWNGSSPSQPDWTDNLVDAVNQNPAIGFVWPAAGYAALLANDAARGQADIDWVYAQEFTGQADPPPMTVADAGWLLRGLNIIASNVPTSTVTALPAGESSSSFALSWSGQGYVGGPAIASYDIFISDNGGPFTPLLTNTTQTSATFAGQSGHTYAFFSVATDELGNVQPTPTTQATTFVRITPVITWNNPPDIVYGAALGATQLNATASIDGTFSYTLANGTTPANGIILGAGLGLTLNVTFTPTDGADYNSATGSVVINVLKATPVITWSNPPDITYGTSLGATQLDATASLGGTFSYTLADGATPANGAILGAGLGQTLNVTFTPTDTSDYAIATDNVTINVTQASQSILFNVSSPASYGSSIALSASGGGSGNPVTFTVLSGLATLNGDTLAFTGVGTVVVEADQAGNANYAAAPAVQRVLFVAATYLNNAASENENGKPTAITVSSALGSHYSDPDGSANTKPGIAVFQTSGPGAWQYSTNGSTWTAIGNVSQAQALLLPGSDSLRFVPATNFSGQVDLFFVAWDGSQGKAGSTADIAVSGGATPFSVNAGTLVLTVNAAPIWVGSGAALTSLLPGTYSTSNQTTPAGDTIAAVFGSYFQDNDPAVVSVGVAIESVTGLASGAWQFLTSGSATWTNFPTISSTSALLLSAGDQIRFVPKSNFAGTVSLKALAWDGIVGVHGATGNPAKLGGGDFSNTTLTATAPVNRAPTLSPALLSEWSVVQYATSAAATVASLLAKAGYADPDGKGLPQGIAVVGTSSDVGTVQYMLSGGSWQPLPSVAPAAALLLPSTALLRFVAGNPLGTATTTLTFAGWDQTQGAAGQTFDITAAGGATAFSTAQATLLSTVTASANHAPTLSTQAVSEAAVAVFTTSPALTVATLLSQAGYADQNGSKLPQGIAIVGPAAGATWQYLLAGGSWQSLPGVSPSSALLLPSNASLRLLTGSQVGTATLTFDGWDQTQGSAGQLFNVANVGGASAFSTTATTASILVVNHAPTLARPNVALAAVNENVSSPAVTAATLLSKAGAADTDGKSVPSGIAVTGDTGAGTWQWLNGATWTALPSVSNSLAFLLPGAAQLRFQPADNLATNTNGSATLSYLAWDETAGAADTTFALTSQGGASAFSAAAATASMPVNFVKQAPAWLPGVSASFTTVLGFSASNPTPNPAGDTVAAVFGSAFHDAPSIPIGVAISAQSGTSVGVWQYSTTNGTTWQAFPAALSTRAALLLSAADKIRFVPSKPFSGTASLTAYAWDGAALSPTALMATCLVNSAPTLT